MSDESTDDDVGDMSPEISPLPPPPPPSSRLELSKMSRKKLNFEEVSRMLGSHTNGENKSNKVSEKRPGRSPGERELPSQSSKLNSLAREYRKNDKIKTPSQSTLAAKRKGTCTSSSNGKVPSKTPPALRRHSETTTPHLHPRPLSKGAGKTPENSHSPSDKHSTLSDSRKRPATGLEHESSSSVGSISDSEPPPKRSSIESQLTKILREVQKANTRLDSYDVKFDSVQERLQKLEEKPTSSSISSSDTSVMKRKVPPEVCVSMSNWCAYQHHSSTLILSPSLHPSQLPPLILQLPFSALTLFFSLFLSLTYHTPTHTYTHTQRLFHIILTAPCERCVQNIA